MRLPQLQEDSRDQESAQDEKQIHADEAQSDPVHPGDWHQVLDHDAADRHGAQAVEARKVRRLTHSHSL
jgi:hypothetical protein